MSRETVIKLRILSLLNAFAVMVTAALPWFYLPVMGWEIPAPPWNWCGFSLLVLAGCLMLRGTTGAWARWLVRPTLFFSVYLWWNSTAALRSWGIKILGPIQMRLSTINVALEQLGGEGVEIFRAQAWKSLEPGLGWYSAGAVLLVTGILTALDRSSHRQCPGCHARTGEQDHYCHACGKAVSDRPLCGRCGDPQAAGDRHCRNCGTRFDKEICQ